MPPRFKSGLALACLLLAFYIVFWRDETPFEVAEHPVEVLPNNFGDPNNPSDNVINLELPPAPAPLAPPAPVRPTSQAPAPTKSQSIDYHQVPTSASRKTRPSKVPTPSKDSQASKLSLQEQYKKEYKLLGEKDDSGAIYGQTLNILVDAGVHKGLAASQLTVTESGSWSEYSTVSPKKLNPYPDYNGEAWRTQNQGEYKACEGPNGPIEDIVVWSGHPGSLSEAAMGSWAALGVDSNLCFERETRLGPYGFTSGSPLEERTDSKKDVDWGQMQQSCVDVNSGRFPKGKAQHQATVSSSLGTANNTSRPESEKRRRTTAKLKPLVKHNSTAESEISTKKLQGTTDPVVMPKKRTALIIRSSSDQEYTENDKQNIRSLVSELCLRSGGEYQVYLLVQVKEDVPIWTDVSIYQKVLKDSVPEEFRSMAILWSDTQMKELYPLISEDVNNIRQSQWLPVQKFALDHPEFDFYWNWEFDVRYTGHYYDLLEKIATWSKDAPRKGLWERSERFYMPGAHSTYTKFLETLVKVVGNNIIWGPARTPKVTPSGPAPPTKNPKDDQYKWGIGEDADFISLAPIFNPVNTTWPSRNDIWGYAEEDTPRRATIGTHSRCSKKILSRMHIENVKGNYITPEMAPPTVALLHGFKAVFAPIPVFFDRTWSGKSLQKFFNPGPKGVSGSTKDSPFSVGNIIRFQGATWFYKEGPSMQLWNNWLGRKDNGIGGPEWEKSNGRMCLPPMLLHSTDDVTRPKSGHNLKTDLLDE